ncbi:hypothetical protein [Streptomyces sp. NBC_00057]
MTEIAAIISSTRPGRNGAEPAALLDQLAAWSSALATPRTAAPEA